MTGCTSGGYDQLEISPETIEQELRPAFCNRRQTDILMEKYSIEIYDFSGSAIAQNVTYFVMIVLTILYMICSGRFGYTWDGAL